MLLPQPVSGDRQGRTSYSNLLALGDERIMQELQTGNTDAFAVIFKRYHRLVHVTALHILRDAAEAEDLTQSVFLEVYRKAGQFDVRRGTLKVWLLQYAYSRSINRRNYLLVRRAYHGAEVNAIDEEASLWSPTRLQFQETRRLATEALEALPDAQKQVLDMRIDLLERHLFISDAAPRRIPSIGDEDVDFSIAGEQLRELIFNELYLGRSDVEMANIIAQRQDRIIEPHPQARPAERIHIGAHDVGGMRCLACACRPRLCRPYAEAIVMPGRQATPGHVGRLRRHGPLIGVECSGMKQIKGRRRITPFAVLKCRHVEMHEHAETQIYKSLLEIEERQSATRSYAKRFVLFRCSAAITGQHIAAVADCAASRKNSLLVAISDVRTPLARYVLSKYKQFY